MSNLHHMIAEDWWDGRQPETFFPSVYYQGDDSREGYLNRVTLEQSTRTIRECDFVVDEFENHLPGHVPSKFRVLDCPCGQGRHSIELARRGYHVVGTDLCPVAIASARTALGREPKDVQERCSFVEDDMRSLHKVGNDYAALINMFFSFGFFSADGNTATLRAFHSVLGPHGLLLIHTDVNRYLIDSEEYSDPKIRTLPDGSRLVIEEHWNKLTNRLDGSWTITSPSGAIKSAPYSVRIYKSGELQSRLGACGFDFVAEKAVPVFGQKLPIQKSQELIYLAMKA
jgi:SAM-dependent methyltransferase